MEFIAFSTLFVFSKNNFENYLLILAVLFYDF